MGVCVVTWSDGLDETLTCFTETQIAFGTVFGQLFRGLSGSFLEDKGLMGAILTRHGMYIGQTSGVAIESVVFQFHL